LTDSNVIALLLPNAIEGSIAIFVSVDKDKIHVWGMGTINQLMRFISIMTGKDTIVRE